MEFTERVPFSAALFTAGVCLLLWCAIVKLFSMFVSLDDDEDNSGFVSVIDMFKEEYFLKQNRDDQSLVRGFETQSRVSYVDFDEHEEEESMDETVGSMSTSNNDEICGIELELDDLVGETATEEVDRESREAVRVLECEDDKEKESDEKDGEEEEGWFDDWEGIERTELERRFGAAVVFVGSQNNAGRVSGLDTETKMRLYGLHKIATEGPCRVPQPMALKVSARTHW